MCHQTPIKKEDQNAEIERLEEHARMLQEAERNKLITAVADHVTVRAEQAEKIKQLKTQKFAHFNNEDAPAAIEQAIAEEREACAKTCESLFDDEDDSYNEADICAAAIRARGNPHETS